MKKRKIATILLSAVVFISLLQGCAKKTSQQPVETAGDKARVEQSISTDDKKEDKQPQTNTNTAAQSSATPEAGANSATAAPASTSSNTVSQTTKSTKTQTTVSTAPASTPVVKQPAPKPAPVVQNTSTPAVKPIESKPVEQPIVTAPTATVNVEDDFTTVVRANLEQGKDTTIKVSSEIINKGIGKLAIGVAEDSGLGGYVSSVQYSLQGDTAFIHFEYKGGKDSFLSKFSTVNSKVSSIVSSVIKSGMTDFQKELALHDYVVNHTKYDIEGLQSNKVSDDDYTAYGVFVKGLAVCSGYAEAMYRLLNKAGIQALMVSGTADGVPHAWNIVKIGGSYYQLDATFDDPVDSANASNNILSYNYFNITDAQIGKDHVWNKTDYPACTATAANYYIMNKIYAKDYSQYYDIVKNGLIDKQIDIKVKVVSNDTNTFTPKVVFNVIKDNPDINFVDLSAGYSYSFDPNNYIYDFYVTYK